MHLANLDASTGSAPNMQNGWTRDSNGAGENQLVHQTADGSRGLRVEYREATP